MMWAVSQPRQKLQKPSFAKPNGLHGNINAVRQRFLDPAVFSSKSGLIPECMAFFAVFSDYIATLKSQHG